VYGRASAPARSCIISSHRHILSSEECSALQATGLLDLRQQRLRIADKQIADVFAVLEFRLQKIDRAANHERSARRPLLG
jgi:hypothetical protein